MRPYKTVGGTERHTETETERVRERYSEKVRGAMRDKGGRSEGRE